MSIAKPSRPEYSLTIPSTGKRIKYQPFTVKEEKVLVLAANSENMDEIQNAIGNVLSGCVTSPADFDPEKLALFDLEILFLKARGKSMGESINLKVTDPNDESYTADYSLNLDSIKLKKFDGHTTTIDVNSDTKVKMKYPGIEFFSTGLRLDDVRYQSQTVAKCISQITKLDGEVHNCEDLTFTEIHEWVESLTVSEYGNLMNFLNTMPKLEHTISLLNPNTGEKFEKQLAGLADFFTSQ